LIAAVYKEKGYRVRWNENTDDDEDLIVDDDDDDLIVDDDDDAP
jgi:hypothetical protein